MIRPTSSTDARVRWYREYQKERNTLRGMFRRMGSCVVRAFHRMPLRMRRTITTHHPMIVDTRGIGIRYASMDPVALHYAKRALVDAYRHRHSRDWHDVPRLP
jgi:hypothetical protein